MYENFYIWRNGLQTFCSYMPSEMLSSCQDILFIYYLFVLHSFNPWEVEKPTGLQKKSVHKWIKYTYSHQQANRLNMNFNNYGSKFIGDYIECKTKYINIIAVNIYKAK